MFKNWQGKVYKIKGSEPGIPNLAEMTGYDIDENGKGKVLNLLGLHGYNCRHSHKPWDKDLKNPYVDEKGNPIIDQEESRKLYEKQQKQRAMERAIRKTKRELLMKQKEIDMVAETDVKDILQKDYDQLAGTLRKQNKAYHKFCEENDLQTQQDRLKVAGFKRAQAAKARGRARAYEHGGKSNEMADMLDFSVKKNAGAMSGALNDENDPLGEKRETHAKMYYQEISNRKKSVVIRTMFDNTKLRVKTVETVYNHVFIEKHQFANGEIKKFFPDYYMAQSFQRILEGKNVQKHDFILMRHERLEYLLMKKYNMVYEDAHNIAEKKYNYVAELKKYLRRRS